MQLGRWFSSRHMLYIGFAEHHFGEQYLSLCWFYQSLTCMQAIVLTWAQQDKRNVGRLKETLRPTTEKNASNQKDWHERQSRTQQRDQHKQKSHATGSPLCLVPWRDKRERVGHSNSRQCLHCKDRSPWTFCLQIWPSFPPQIIPHSYTELICTWFNLSSVFFSVLVADWRISCGWFSNIFAL